MDIIQSLLSLDEILNAVTPGRRIVFSTDVVFFAVSQLSKILSGLLVRPSCVAVAYTSRAYLCRGPLSRVDPMECVAKLRKKR